MNLGNKAVTVTTRSRNLIPFPYSNNTVNANIIKTSYDGKITVNGTSTTNAKLLYDITKGLEAGKAYTLSGCPNGGDYGVTYCLYAVIKGADGKNQFKYDEGSGVTFTLPEYTTVRVFLYLKSGYEANHLVFKPMLNEGDTALPFEPYIQRHDMRVMQNLIDVDKMVGNALSKNEDGSYTITKGEGWNGRVSLPLDIELPIGKYAYSLEAIEKNTTYWFSFFVYYKNGGETQFNYWGSKITITLTGNTSRVILMLRPAEVDGTYITFKNLRLYRLA